MGLVKADAKIRIKRTELLGVEPTPGPSLDHTDGSWNDTDIYVGELFQQVGQPGLTGSVERLWLRTAETIRNIPLATNGGSAGQILILDEDNDTCTWTDMPDDLVGFEIAENGLYAVAGTTVRIGGPLIEDTTISGGTYSFTFNSATAGIEYGGNYHSNYTLRSLVDKEYVDLAVAAIDTEQTTASNGLSLIGYDIQLGGTLSNTTYVNTDGNSLVFGSGITPSIADMVYVEQLNVNQLYGNTASNLLAIDTEGNVVDGNDLVADLVPGRETITATTTDDIPTLLYTIPTIAGEGITYRVLIKGVTDGAVIDRVIGGDMLFVALNTGGTASLIGGLDHNMKSSFGTAYFDAIPNGSDVELIITGEDLTDINWTAIVEYV
jgi:hypothetical protein